jgi:hypothetical protein
VPATPHATLIKAPVTQAGAAQAPIHRPPHEVAAQACCRAAVAGLAGALAFLPASLFILHAEAALRTFAFAGLLVAVTTFFASLVEEFAARGERRLPRVLLGSLVFPFLLYAVGVWVTQVYYQGPFQALLEVAERLISLPGRFFRFPIALVGGTLAHAITFAGFLIMRERVESRGRRYGAAAGLGLLGGTVATLCFAKSAGSEAVMIVLGVVGALLAINFGFTYGERLATKVARRYEDWARGADA